MLSEQQMEMRKSGVGASESAAVMGLSPYGGPMDVWVRKVGILNDDPNEAQEAGTYLEDGIARWVAKIHGFELQRVNRTLRSSRWPWMLATPDRFIVERRFRRALLEIKDVGHDSDEWGAEGTDEIPKHHLVQVQQQLAVTGMAVGKLVAFFHDRRRRPRVYHVERSAALQEAIVDVVGEFWEKHVVARVPPELDGSGGSKAYLRATYGTHGERIVDAPSDCEKWALQYMEARDVESAAQARKDEAGNFLKAWIGADAGVRGPWGTATWKLSKGEGVNWEAVARELATGAEQLEAAMAKHGKPAERRLRITEPKK